ncbi:MAG: CO/xanthine dehydrogenase Mo-binding subunit [Planctomycetota bacterium]|jgi:CO/xanthine dehydrogenase Mo-binding subunit
MNPSIIGSRVPRDDGHQKVTGQALYVDDLRVPGMIYGTTVRSTVARAKVLAVDWDDTYDWTGITRVTARDIPGKNSLPLLIDDQRILARRNIRHRHEPIALLACADKARLREARGHVRLRYESRPMVSQIEDSLEAEIRVFGDDNIFKDISIHKGDPASVLPQCDIQLEETYTTGHQEHLYIETQGMIAEWQDDVLVLTGSLQCPYYVHKAMKAVFDLTDDQVRVIQATTGGGFGGKEEYPSLLAAHAALLAKKAEKPVKMIYDRAEDMAATTKRHPSEVTIRAGVNQEGVLQAIDIDVVLDGGAYCTLSPVVLSRAILHAVSAYRCDNIAVRGRVVATNTPPNGAFRGFGAPQTIFAMERMMDLIASRVEISPMMARARNHLVNGDTTATGQLLAQGVSAGAVLARACEAAGFEEKWQSYQDARDEGGRRGIGIALFMHGCGFTGHGERDLKGRAAVRLFLKDDLPRAEILASTTDIGQGMRTTFRQMAAEALGIPYEQVGLAPPDTKDVPDSGPTVASRTCMVVGSLVVEASHGCLTDLGLSLGATHEAIRLALESKGQSLCQRQYTPAPDLHWDDKTYQGSAYPTYGFGCTICEVEVDPVTFDTTILDVVTCQDVGKAIHPSIVEGQIEGGTVQALGFAGFERVVMRDGSMINHDVSNYVIPTAVDIAPIRILIHEEPYAGGPFGAKGIGEMPMDGGAPAYIAAVSQATGVSFRDVPVLSEDVFEALTEKKKQEAAKR